MAGYMTPQEFANKIDYEGGIVSALDYGLHAEDLDDTPKSAPLRETWAELERVYREHMGPAVEKVRALLPEPREDDEPDDEEDGGVSARRRADPPGPGAPVSEEVR